MSSARATRRRRRRCRKRYHRRLDGVGELSDGRRAAGPEQDSSAASEEARAVALDAAGNAYVTGVAYSGDFPTQTPLQAAHGAPGTMSPFVAKLNAAGSALSYSTFLGGSSGLDEATAIAIDSAGSAYVAGSTSSTDFPKTCGGEIPISPPPITPLGSIDGGARRPAGASPSSAVWGRSPL